MSTLETRKVCVLSLAHLMTDTWHDMKSKPPELWGFTGAIMPHGAFVYASEEPGDHLSPDLINCMEFARREGFEYILFDEDADPVEGLPNHQAGIGQFSEQMWESFRKTFPEAHRPSVEYAYQMGLADGEQDTRAEGLVYEEACAKLWQVIRDLYGEFLNMDTAGGIEGLIRNATRMGMQIMATLPGAVVEPEDPNKVAAQAAGYVLRQQFVMDHPRSVGTAGAIFATEDEAWRWAAAHIAQPAPRPTGC
jgi:hypothetical protein